jgi:hypothetical protein
MEQYQIEIEFMNGEKDWIDPVQDNGITEDENYYYFNNGLFTYDYEKSHVKQYKKLPIKTCCFQKTKTERGFSIITFKDYYDAECSIQKSSLATKDAIWIGINDSGPKVLSSNSTRMHLTREQVDELLPILQNFVDTGEI